MAVGDLAADLANPSPCRLQNELTSPSKSQIHWVGGVLSLKMTCHRKVGHFFFKINSV